MGHPTGDTGSSPSGPGAGMQASLLGPLALSIGGSAVPVTSAKQRLLLAGLLMNANRPVPFDTLSEMIWGDCPPASAHATMRNYVKRLRRILAAAGSGRITTHPGGYQINIARDDLDVTRFEALDHAARQAEQHRAWPRAAALAREALALWRGPPFADLRSGAWSQREGLRLEEIRTRTLEIRIAADLELGRHHDVVAELQALVSADPLRERWHALLMLALYRDDRQADALAAYQRARRVLLTELGVEAGPALRDLQQRILSADPSLQPRAAALPDEPPASHPPDAVRQLPVSVRPFTGRHDELTTLAGWLDDDTEAGVGVIGMISGTAGVGKSALAVHFAHQVAGRFPDGQLYVNLRGYDESEPMSVATALAGFLRALGTPGPAIPADTDERSAAYRSLVAGRRMLVVLDNASQVEQVRPLLPGSSSCVTLVTSRDTLPGLVARNGAVRLSLGPLPLADAMALLRKLIGERAVADPEAVARLVTCCCLLPLALRIAAELAVSRPDSPLAVLAAELDERQRRLDLLDAGGDSRTAIREVFSWSYKHLDSETARAFRMAALHPGHDFDAYALAALTGSDYQQASRMLRYLARAHLIQQAGEGRYGMHDLLRAFGHELSAADAEGTAAHAALTGLLDYVQSTAARAMDNLFPAEADQRPGAGPADQRPGPAPADQRLGSGPADSVSPVSGEHSARAWLDAERANLVALVAYAAEHGWPGRAVSLTAIVCRYFNVAGYFSEALTILQSAVDAAALTGDRSGEAQALINLGNIHLRQSRHEQAARHLGQARILCRQTDDRLAEWRVLNGLAMISQMQGRYQQAADYFQQILDIGRSAGSQFQEARGLVGLGSIALLQGRYQEAASQLHRSIELCRLLGERVLLAGALINLGELDLRRGRYRQAGDHFRQSRAVCLDSGDQVAELHVSCYLALADLRQGQYSQAASQLRGAVTRFRDIGYRNGEAQALCHLGELSLRTGSYQQARDDLWQALAICRETGDLPGQTEVLDLLGAVYLATGQLADARAQHAGALVLATQLGDPYQQARAHRGLGDFAEATGDDVQASHHWQEALVRFAELETPEADQLRARLPGPVQLAFTIAADRSSAPRRPVYPSWRSRAWQCRARRMSSRPSLSSRSSAAGGSAASM